MEKIILGIDPGTNVMGYGILEVRDRQPRLVAMGVLTMKKTESHYLRLRRIYERTCGLIRQFHPDELAVESPFLGINVQSLVKLCRAQGAAICAAVEHDLPVFEYPPMKIKQAIVGNGAAAKEQVQAMLRRILHLTDDDMTSEKLDASDAVAAALCHHYETSRPVASTGGGAKTWKDFVARNADKVHQNQNGKK